MRVLSIDSVRCVGNGWIVDYRVPSSGGAIRLSDTLHLPFRTETAIFQNQHALEEFLEHLARRMIPDEDPTRPFVLDDAGVRDPDADPGNAAA